MTLGTVAVKRKDPVGHQGCRAHAYLEQQAGKVSKRREKSALRFGGALEVPLGYKNEGQVRGRKRRPRERMCLGVVYEVEKVFFGPLLTLKEVTPATQEKMEVWSCLAHSCLVCVLHWQRHPALCLFGTFCSKF